MDSREAEAINKLYQTIAYDLAAEENAPDDVLERLKEIFTKSRVLFIYIEYHVWELFSIIHLSLSLRALDIVDHFAAKEGATAARNNHLNFMGSCDASWGYVKEAIPAPKHAHSKDTDVPKGRTSPRYCR